MFAIDNATQNNGAKTHHPTQTHRSGAIQEDKTTGLPAVTNDSKICSVGSVQQQVFKAKHSLMCLASSDLISISTNFGQAWFDHHKLYVAPFLFFALRPFKSKCETLSYLFFGTRGCQNCVTPS